MVNLEIGKLGEENKIKNGIRKSGQIRRKIGERSHQGK